MRVPRSPGDHPRPHAVGGSPATRRQLNPSPLVELHQQAARGHVFQSARPRCASSIPPPALPRVAAGSTPDAPRSIRESAPDRRPAPPGLAPPASHSLPPCVEYGRKDKWSPEENAGGRTNRQRTLPAQPVTPRRCLQSVQQKLNSSGRKQQLGPSPVGQPNVPFSSRLAQTHSPEPSQYTTLSRFRLRLVNKNRWPDSGSCASTLWTRADSR